MFERFRKRAVENVKGAVKEEAVQCFDDLFPTLVGVASLALIVLMNVQAPRPVGQTITINNYYFGR